MEPYKEPTCPKCGRDGYVIDHYWATDGETGGDIEIPIYWCEMCEEEYK